MNQNIATIRSDENKSVGIVASLRQFLPTVTVLGLMVGIALWGHMTEWNFGIHRSRYDAESQERSTPFATLRIGTVASNAGNLPAEVKRPMSLVFPSGDVVDKAGIDVTPVWTAPMTESLP